MQQKHKASILQKEVFLPGISFDKVLPPRLEEWLGTFSVGIFIIAPVIMAILAMIHKSIDYTFVIHPTLIRQYIYPLSGISGLLTILIFAVRRVRRRNLLLLWLEHRVLGLFLFATAWMLVAQAVNGMLFQIGFSVVTREETWPMQVGYFLLLLPAGILVRNERKKCWLIRLHLLASLVLVAAALVLWNAQTTSVFFYDWKPWFSSIYTNPNFYGYYLSISVPLAAAMFVAEKKLLWKAFAALALAFNTVALIFTDTLGASLACIAAMLFILITHAIMEKRLDRDALIAALLFLYCFVLAGIASGYLQSNLSGLMTDFNRIATQAEDLDRAGSGRWHIWKASLELIGKNPVFGMGFEGIYLNDLKSFVYNTRPHNEVMQYALFYGIPAGVSYFAGCLGMYIRALKRKSALSPATLACLTAAFGYLVSSCFGITLYCTAPFLFLFLGMGYVV